MTTKSEQPKPVFIAATSTMHTGGNCMADLITLKSGKAIVLIDDGIAIYPTADSFINGSGEDYFASLWAGDSFEGFARCEEGTGALTFVQSIDAYEPDGPVSIDLLVLADGRVIGINDECVVIYADREDVESNDIEEERPSLSFDPDEQDVEPLEALLRITALCKRAPDMADAIELFDRIQRIAAKGIAHEQDRIAKTGRRS